MGGEVREDRDASGLGEPQQLVGDPGLEGARAGHDHRPLGRGQHVQGRLDGLGRGSWTVGEDQGLGDMDAVLLHPRVQDVRGQVQQHGAGRSGGGDADGVGDQPGDVADVGDAVRPLGDRARDGGLVDARLQGVGLGVPRRGGAGQVDHRRTVEKGVGDRGDHIGEAGAGGDHGHAQPAARARIALGRVPGGDLMTHIDDRNAVVEAGLENAFHMRPVQTEDRLHPRLQERPHQELSARHRRHPVLR